MTTAFNNADRSRRLPEEDASRHVDSMMPVRPVRPVPPASFQAPERTQALPVKTRKQLRLERAGKLAEKPYSKEPEEAMPEIGMPETVDAIPAVNSSAIMDGEAEEYSMRDKRLRKLGREFSLIVFNDDVIADPWVFNSSFSERHGDDLEPKRGKKNPEVPEVDLQTLESRIEILLERFCAKNGIKMKPASREFV